MKSFIQYLCENAVGEVPTGNYVSVDVDMPVLPKEYLPFTGTVLPDRKAHITVIYSKETSEDCDKILSTCLEHGISYLIKVKSAASFDDIPKDDETNQEFPTAAVVLKVECAALDDLHKKLSDIHGLKHSYEKYEPHISIAYGVEKGEADQLVKDLNVFLKNRDIVVFASRYKSQPIIKDWGKLV